MAVCIPLQAFIDTPGIVLEHQYRALMPRYDAVMIVKYDDTEWLVTFWQGCRIGEMLPYNGTLPPLGPPISSVVKEVQV